MIVYPAEIVAALESGRAVVAEIVEMSDSRPSVPDVLLTNSQIPITVEGKTYMPRVGTMALVPNSIRLPVSRGDWKRERATFAVSGTVTLPVPNDVIIGFAILLENGINIMASDRQVQFSGEEDGSIEVEEPDPDDPQGHRTRIQTVMNWTGEIAKTRHSNKFVMDRDEQELRSTALGKARDTSLDHTDKNRTVRWGGQSRLESGGVVQRVRQRFGGERPF